MGDSQVIAFALAAAVLTMAPGPDTMLVIRNVLRGGRRDGVRTTLGICSGLFVHATLSACGVSMLLIHSATAFHLLKLAGAGYLVWLGLQSLRQAIRTPPPADRLEAVAPPGRGTLRQCFREGLPSAPPLAVPPPAARAAAPAAPVAGFQRAATGSGATK